MAKHKSQRSLFDLLRKDRPEPATLTSALAQGFVAGMQVDWRGAIGKANFVELPTYTFERRRFWLSSDGPAVDAAGLGLTAGEHALLGAVALGDLGRHFPPGDPRWKDASSLELLRLIRALLAGKGATIVNVDATVIAEAPRIAPLREAMCLNIAQALRLGPGQVSVKATTNEALGAIGRGEGLAAMAIAMVEVA